MTSELERWARCSNQLLAQRLHVRSRLLGATHEQIACIWLLQTTSNIYT